MESKRQPKVHKYTKKKSRRVTSPGRTLLSVGVTFLIAGAIGVVGYSIAKPILQYSKEDVPQESETSASLATDVTAIETTLTLSEASTVQTMTVAAQAADALCNGVRLSETALSDEVALQQAIAAARQSVPDGKILVIPLKIQGGALLYQTNVTQAQQCGAAQGTLSLAAIVSAALADGWTPVAECSLLYDNLLPELDAQAGYMIADGSSRWLDNTKENGGKAWLSPFSTAAEQYLTAITEEIAAAGFSQIWCTDVIFPPFRDSDLTYIGDEVQQSDRGQALVQLVNQLSDAVGTVPVLLEADVAGVLAGTEEAFDADTLEASGIVLRFGEDAPELQTVTQWVSETIPDWNIWLTGSTAVLSEEMRQVQGDSSGIVLSGCVVLD